MAKYLLTTLILFHSWKLFSQAGTLDSSFGINGRVVTYMGMGNDFTSGIIQIDGKIIAVGYYCASCLIDYKSTVLRYTHDGVLDSAFGWNGAAFLMGLGGGNHATAVALQSDGKIVVAGFELYDAELARFNVDGSFDNTFNLNGEIVSDSPNLLNAIAIQPDGKIVAAGASWMPWPKDIMTVERLNINGTLDSSFSGGMVKVFADSIESIAYSLLLQPDGKIILVGEQNPYNSSAFEIARLNAGGNLDSTFSEDGIAFFNVGMTGHVTSAALQLDGKIIVAGSFSNGVNSEIVLMRSLPDGSIDTSFGNNGKVVSDFGQYDDEDAVKSIAIQSDGKIVAIANYLVRYDTSGLIDSSFGINGSVKQLGIGGNHVLIAPDGKILTIGAGFTLARYHSGLNVGIVNFSLPFLSPIIYPNPIQDEEFFEYTLSEDKDLSITLYDVNGVRIKTFMAHEFRTRGNHKEALEFGTLSRGIYCLQLSNGVQNVNVKVVRQ